MGNVSYARTMEYEEERQTVAILREACEVLQAFKLPLQDVLERLQQTVSCPAGQFMEWDKLIAFCEGFRSVCPQRVTWPNISEGDAPQLGSRSRPYNLQTFDKHVPQSRDVYFAVIRSVDYRLGFQEI